jgi:hypothetical protein
LLANASITPISAATNKKGRAIARQRFHNKIGGNQQRRDSQLLCNSSVSTIPRQRRDELFKRVFTTELAARLWRGGYRQFSSSSAESPIRDSLVHASSRQGVHS